VAVQPRKRASCASPKALPFRRRAPDFPRVSLQVARGRDLPIITQAETLEAYLPLRDDLLRTSYAAYAVELLDRFTYEEGEHQGLYRLLTETLERLCQPAEYDFTVRFYEMRLLDQGIRPQLLACTSWE
jgi:DNA repair protein RecO (recombination protein O)